MNPIDPMPLRGVTVMPEYFQFEGVAPVLDRLQDAGVNAVTTSPYVMEPADEQTGGREPPIDAGAGSVRLLDRPLWGRRELWVQTAPSFEPDRSLYHGLRYQPAEPTALTRREGGIVDEVIASAAERGMRVYLQVQAAIPPGYRVQFGGPADDDRPRLPDGRLADRRVANNGSLASPHIQDYTAALLTDLCRRYPRLDGIRVDWPEYPPYFLDDCFFDFSEPARVAAERLAIDFEQLRAAATNLYGVLHGGLSNELIEVVMTTDSPARLWAIGLGSLPGLQPWADFKATLVTELLARFRSALDAAGTHRMQLLAHAFPPPWSIASGIDFERAGAVVDAFCVKLYGMHWGMMVRFYVDQLQAANPGLDELPLIRAVTRFLDVVDDAADADQAADATAAGAVGGSDSTSCTADDPAVWRYPEPNEPHPGGLQAQRRKIAAAQKAAATTPVYTLAHGYGPPDDFRRRIAALHDASPHGIWLNRYGYLGDEKLAFLRSLS